MARIFISHSSRDDEAAARMKAWLASQGFENAFLDKDRTTGIPPGHVDPPLLTAARRGGSVTIRFRGRQ